MSERKFKNESSFLNILKNVKYDMFQNKITSGPPPSLMYIALNKVAITLWNNEIKNSGIEQVEEIHIDHKMNSYKNEILNKLSCLEIPADCKEALLPIINSISVELINYFSYEINFFRSSTIKGLKLFWDDIIWTQQGTINTLKTVKQIVSHRVTKKEKAEDDNIKHIFELACNNCLVEEVQCLLNKLPARDVTFKSNDINIRYHLMEFFILSGKGQNEEFYKISNGTATNEYLLKWAITYKKKAAVQYIWENLAEDAMKEQLVDYVDFTINNSRLCCRSNILLYFCKQFSHTQLKEAKMEVHFGILKEIHSISRGCNVISVPKYMLEFFKGRNVFDAFKIIEFCFNENFINLEELKSVWNEFALQFKLELEKNKLNIYDKHVNWLLQKGRNISIYNSYIILLFLGISTSDDKKILLHKENTIRMFGNWLIYWGRFELLSTLINDVFKEENKIASFKKIFFKSRFSIICWYFLVNDKYEMVDEFLVKFCSENKLQFKNKMLYENDLEIVKDIIKRNAHPFETLNKFFHWSFNDNLKEISKFKACVFDLKSNKYQSIRAHYFNKIRKVITSHDWESIIRYWTWIFLATEDQILLTPKDKFWRILRILYFTTENSINLSHNKCYELLTTFLTFCFKETEAEELVEELKCNNSLLDLVKRTLNVYKLEKSYLDFCKSKKSFSFEINETRVMIASTIFYALMGYYIKINRWSGWFNPWLESDAAFKECMESFHYSLTLPNTSYIFSFSCMTKIVRTIRKNLVCYSKEKSIFFKAQEGMLGDDQYNCKKKRNIEEQQSETQAKKKRF